MVLSHEPFFTNVCEQTGHANATRVSFNSSDKGMGGLLVGVGLVVVLAIREKPKVSRPRTSLPVDRTLVSSQMMIDHLLRTGRAACEHGALNIHQPIISRNRKPPVRATTLPGCRGQGLSAKAALMTAWAGWSASTQMAAMWATKQSGSSGTQLRRPHQPGPAKGRLAPHGGRRRGRHS